MSQHFLPSWSGLGAPVGAQLLQDVVKTAGLPQDLPDAGGRQVRGGRVDCGVESTQEFVSLQHRLQGPSLIFCTESECSLVVQIAAAQGRTKSHLLRLLFFFLI